MESAQGMTGEPGRSQADFPGHFPDPLWRAHDTLDRNCHASRCYPVPHALSGITEKFRDLAEQALEIDRLGIVVITTGLQCLLLVARHGMGG